MNERSDNFLEVLIVVLNRVDTLKSEFEWRFKVIVLIRINVPRHQALFETIVKTLEEFGYTDRRKPFVDGP